MPGPPRFLRATSGWARGRGRKVWRARAAAAISRGMARTVLLRLPDGTYAIRPGRRYAWVWLAIAAACVLGPLLLSLVVSLPAFVFLLPVWTLGVGLWV